MNMELIKKDLNNFVERCVFENASFKNDGIYCEIDDLSKYDVLSIIGRLIAYHDFDISDANNKISSVGSIISEFFTYKISKEDFVKKIQDLFLKNYKNLAQQILKEKINDLEVLHN